MEHQKLARQWHDVSNNIVIVNVASEHELLETAAKCFGAIPYSLFSEPDLNHQTTALAIGPGDSASRLCSSMPLALKEVVVV